MRLREIIGDVRAKVRDAVDDDGIEEVANSDDSIVADVRNAGLTLIGASPICIFEMEGADGWFNGLRLPPAGEEVEEGKDSRTRLLESEIPMHLQYLPKLLDATVRRAERINQSGARPETAQQIGEDSQSGRV